MTPLKRSRSEDSEMAVNGLMLLAKLGDVPEFSRANSSADHRVFSCKTCNREFPSFQALGGHRASHKKLPKLSGATSASEDSSPVPASPPKPKTHECSICGLEFAIGQALGGHMRRHRQQIADAAENGTVVKKSSDCDSDDRTVTMSSVPVLKKSNSGKRVCLGLDLDLDLHLGPPGSAYRNDPLALRLMSTPLC